MSTVKCVIEGDFVHNIEIGKKERKGECGKGTNQTPLGLFVTLRGGEIVGVSVVFGLRSP
jgi:hypothetical protein